MILQETGQPILQQIEEDTWLACFRTDVNESDQQQDDASCKACTTIFTIGLGRAFTFELFHIANMEIAYSSYRREVAA